MLRSCDILVIEVAFLELTILALQFLEVLLQLLDQIVATSHIFHIQHCFLEDRAFVRLFALWQQSR